MTAAPVAMPALARWMPAALFLAFVAALTTWCLAFVAGLAGRFPASAATLRVDAWVILTLGIALALLAPLARRDAPRWASIVAGALVGALLYMRTFGWAWLDPTAIDWLMQGDLAQHYTGWAFFRQEPWQWPPGAIEKLRYPVGTSVFFTDAHPLLALLLKPFASLLPQPFQYIGLTYLMSWTLMGATAAGVLRLAVPAGTSLDSQRALLVPALAALMAVLSPVLVMRIGHDTLTAQWLVLAALGLAIWRAQQTPDRRNGEPRARLGWCILAGIASLTHLYLLAMVLAVFCADRLQGVLFDRSLRGRTAIVDGLCVLTTAIPALWLAGAFTVPGDQALDHDNPGRWSADLTSLVDTHGASNLAPWLPRWSMTRPEQWEGWAYLGAGVLLAIVLAVVVIFYQRDARRLLQRSAALWLAAAAMFLFALSPVVTAAGNTLLELEGLRRLPLYSLFRSCGRFVWPLHYLLLLASLLVLARAGRRLAVPLLAVVCLLQIYDLRLHDSFGQRRVAAPKIVAATWSDPRWAELAAGREHVELVSGDGCGKQGAPWLPATQLALRHGMTVNSGYLARLHGSRWHRYCTLQRELLATGARRNDTLYLVHADDLDAFVSEASVSMRCDFIEGQNACVVDPAQPPGAAASEVSAGPAAAVASDAPAAGGGETLPY